MSRRAREYPARTGYDLYARHYRKDHEHLESFDGALVRELLAPLLQPGELVLDLGCGDGRIGKRLLKRCPNLVGLDISAGMLREFRRRSPGVRLVQADLANLPLRPASVDLALALFVLVHLPDVAGFLRQVAVALRPGGRLLLNNLTQRRPPVLDADGEHLTIASHYHPDDEVPAAADATGFAVEERRESREGRAHHSTVFVLRRF